MDTSSNQRLEYLYKEYVRLSNRADDLIQNTYETFKLFGAVSVLVVAWKPISELIASTRSNLDSSLVLFLGFLSLLSVLGIIGLLNLLQQSYTWYFVHNLQIYEREIRKELGEVTDSQVFSFNLGKEEKKFITAVYHLSFRALFISFAFAVIFIPSIILFYSNILHAVIYLSLALIGFLVIYVQVFRKMIKQFSNRKYL